MAILDITEFDFSREGSERRSREGRREAIVHNEDPTAVLHVGIRTGAPWLEVYPTEFALAPGASQVITAELHPERSRGEALSPITVTVFGQYIAFRADQAAQLPADISADIRVTPPLANCPSCGVDLPDGARECRRCGERIRLCPVCGTPNSWLAQTCRAGSAHIIRPETDWRMSPGGSQTHSAAPTGASGIHLARRWSFPAYPSSRPEDTLEWSAPILAFGMAIASAIDAAAGRATIYAFDILSGSPLWDFDLPDPSGIYPDRGAMAVSEEGLLYAATLSGEVIAVDSIRGTRRWGATVKGAVFGGVTAAGDYLLVSAGETLAVLDRRTGDMRRTINLGGRLDSASGAMENTAYVNCDDGYVYAFNLESGSQIWRAHADSAFDAAPIVTQKVVYAAALSGSVYAIDRSTGAQHWRTQVTPRGVSVTPAMTPDGLLLVAADDGFVHIVAAETGHMIRSRRVSATPLRCSPVYSGSFAFFGADDGSIYSLDPDFQVTPAYETTSGARVAAAGLAIYGDTIACTATNGLLYALKTIS